ncbi:hypothetical protein GJ496_002658 [Pomphorhynchus laevis]|nr:hypothetical protein GJ496_002658 [Pomphorhynchus laevis]
MYTSVYINFKDQQGHNDNAQFCFNNKNQIIMFLIRVLQEILNDKECKKAQNSELKKICQSAIDELTNNNDLSGQRDTLPDLIAQIDYNRYFEPFELASKTGSVKLVQLSLDSIQKFIAHGHLLGNCEDPLEPGKHLIDRIIKMICSCFKGEQTNEGVQLQILKALLTILTSQLVDVHASSLLLSIKTCFNICLISRSLINQTTARATLTQIINVVFFKMEQEASSGKHASMLTHTTQLDIDQTNRLENYSLVAGEHDYEIFQLLEEMVSRISADQGSEDQVPSKLRRFSDVLLENSTLSQHDAFYVISSLCKISQRPLFLNSTEERIVSSLEYRSKQLSLQLILAILQNPGPELQSNPIFLSVIRNQLCISLSNNAVSKIPAIFELSMAIFIGLLANFKQYLKLHIEVVFKEILFPILDSPNSSFQHKLIVLRALMAICSDRQIILDIYINYDCNLRSFNVLEQLVHELSRIAQGRTIADLGCATSEEEYSFRIIGIECLVAILYSMKDWAIDMLNDCSDKRSRSNSESSHSSSYSEVKMSELMQDPMNFELIKNHKNIVEYGIELFNQKPSTGLRFLQEQNILKTECTDVASFLHMYEEKLNKRVVGEFLGLGEKLNKEIMFAYVDQLDLSEMSFIAALRKFLSGFRLPGEAQKIDRLMEKFAARYCECNQYLEIFSSADTAYVLAYSIIMLTTDLHSAQIKHKMTKDQYINLNKGINESRDLPYNYLSKIYDEIANEELRMKYPDDERKSKVSEGI